MAQTIDMSKTLNEPYLYKSSFMKDKEIPDEKDTLVKVDSMLEVEDERNNRVKVLRLTIDTQVYRDGYLVYKNTAIFEGYDSSWKYKSYHITHSNDTFKVQTTTTTKEGDIWKANWVYSYNQTLLGETFLVQEEGKIANNKIYNYNMNGNPIMIAYRDNDSIKVLKQIRYSQNEGSDCMGINIIGNDNSGLTLCFDDKMRKTYQEDRGGRRHYKYEKNTYLSYGKDGLKQVVSKSEVMHIQTQYSLKRSYKDRSVTYLFVVPDLRLGMEHYRKRRKYFKFKKEDFYPIKIPDDEFKRLDSTEYTITKSYTYFF